MQKIELLAPAGNFENLNAAIKAGCDAIYFGVSSMNMRIGSAKNFSLRDIKQVMQICRKHKIKGYLTLNTIIYDEDYKQLEKILMIAKKEKVNAIIAMDFAVINLAKKLGLKIHISTQASVSNFETVKFYSKFAKRIILARELSLKQIKNINKKIEKEKLDVELEAFAHGALCVAISGKCFMSQFQNKKSANKGLCLQECRRQYKIVDVEEPSREYVLDNNFVLSPKDLCTLPFIDKMIDSGIKVLKIEGRARSQDYVFTVVNTYRKALNLLENNKLTEHKILVLLKYLSKVFNRGFTNNFYLGTGTNNSWSKIYGSKSNEVKKGLGKITNYYAQKKVASLLIQQNELRANDEVYIIGETTFLRLKINKFMLNNKTINIARQGDEISFLTPEKVRRNDRVFLIKKLASDSDLKFFEELEKIGFSP